MMALSQIIFSRILPVSSRNIRPLSKDLPKNKRSSFEAERRPTWAWPKKTSGDRFTESCFRTITPTARRILVRLDHFALLCMFIFKNKLTDSPRL